MRTVLFGLQVDVVSGLKEYFSNKGKGKGLLGEQLRAVNGSTTKIAPNITNAVIGRKGGVTSTKLVRLKKFWAKS